MSSVIASCQLISAAEQDPTSNPFLELDNLQQCLILRGISDQTWE